MIVSPIIQMPWIETVTERLCSDRPQKSMASSQTEIKLNPQLAKTVVALRTQFEDVENPEANARNINRILFTMIGSNFEILILLKELLRLVKYFIHFLKL